MMAMQTSSLYGLAEEFLAQEKILRQGGGLEGQERQRRLGRMTARERVDFLLDEPEDFFEIGLWAGYGMYSEWGGLPAAGLVAGIGNVANRPCMIIANDATVKAGAMFPQSIKKMLRAQRMAYMCRLPIVYLVDSSGVFLPLQEEIFPDEDDFGRIFRNNAVLSSAGIPQIAAIMGNCIAGGGYLPVLCDQLLMTQGSGLYLAGPALVKAAIGQVVDTEELGGARMHAEISGTVDYLEPDDASCLQKLRSLVSMLPEEPKTSGQAENAPSTDPMHLYSLVDAANRKPYETRDLLACLVDAGSFREYKAEYGKALVTAFASIGGIPVGIVANQRKPTHTGEGRIEIGGVIYAESADKAARFVLTCNQMKTALIFLQDVTGFMVGKDSEQGGIIRSGAKLVNAVSNSVVPKITVLVGNSFGAGHYALCGKAYDPHFIAAWPNARYAVMGSEQAAETLVHIREKAAQRKGKEINEEEHKKLREEVKESYERCMDIRYGAARGWVDAIIAPHETRKRLIQMLSWAKPLPGVSFHTGVIQT